jgi:hypothetical protein
MKTYFACNNNTNQGDEWFGMLLLVFCFLCLICAFSIVGIIVFAAIKLFILR